MRRWMHEGNGGPDLPDNRWAPEAEGGSYREPQDYWEVRGVVEDATDKRAHTFYISREMEEHAIISVLGERVAQVLRWARHEAGFGRAWPPGPQPRSWVEVRRVTL